MIPDVSFNANDSNFTSFECATEDEVLKLLNRSPTKSCNLGPVPTNLLKDYSHVILPIITKIINQFLSSGIFPSTFKTALIRPLLKNLVSTMKFSKTTARCQIYHFCQNFSSASYSPGFCLFFGLTTFLIITDLPIVPTIALRLHYSKWRMTFYQR